MRENSLHGERPGHLCGVDIAAEEIGAGLAQRVGLTGNARIRSGHHLAP